MTNTEPEVNGVPIEDRSGGSRAGLRSTFAHFFWPVVLLGILVLFLVGPISVILETVDMFLMRSVASATILESSVSVDDKGRSRPVVRYQFSVDGVSFVGDRCFPGRFGNWGRSGGGIAASAPSVGSTVRVHYAAGNPGRSCLWYGWFRWSVGMTLIPYGMVLHRVYRARPRSGRGVLLRPIGAAMIVLGFVSLAGPPVLELSHALRYLVIGLGVYLAAMALIRYWDGPGLSGVRRNEIKETIDRTHAARS